MLEGRSGERGLVKLHAEIVSMINGLKISKNRVEGLKTLMHLSDLVIRRSRRDIQTHRFIFLWSDFILCDEPRIVTSMKE